MSRNPKRSQLFEAVEERLTLIDDAIRGLSAKLRELQPEPAYGMLAIRSRWCSDPCLGCPHHSWRSWRHNPRSPKKGSWFELKRVSRKNVPKRPPFADVREELIESVELAQYLIDEKKRIVERLSALRKTLGNLDAEG